MYKISDNTIQAIQSKTPWGHSANPRDEGLNEEEIKGLFYKAITDKEDSVISEINRIVDEANRELELIDNVDRIGLIDDCSLAPEKQHWMRVKNILFIYGNVKLYSDREVESLSDVINMDVGYNTLLKITAPYNIIPDDNLTVTIQGRTFSGLELLRNTAEEALNGKYYFYIAVNKLDGSINNVSIKWNTEDQPKQLLAFFSSVGEASTSEKKLYFRYSINSNGDKMTTYYNKNIKYLGLYYGESAPELAKNYTWVRLKTNQMIWQTHNFYTGEFKDVSYRDFYIPKINIDSHVFVTTEPMCCRDWAKYGVYCEFLTSGRFRVHCNPPAPSLPVLLLIGDMDYDI